MASVLGCVYPPPGLLDHCTAQKRKPIWVTKLPEKSASGLP